MKFRYLSILLILGGTMGQIFSQETMPQESAKLVNQFAKFMFEERRSAEARIEEKKQSVILILNEHLKAQTKAGNLEGAVAIRNQIADLQKGAKLELENAAETEPGATEQMSWEDAKRQFGAVEVTVEAVNDKGDPKSSKVRAGQGQQFKIIPNPSEKWTGGGSKQGKFCDYQGYKPDDLKDTWMRLFYVIENGKPQPVDPSKIVTSEEAGFIRLFAEDTNPVGNSGEVRVVIVPVK